MNFTFVVVPRVCFVQVTSDAFKYVMVVGVLRPIDGIKNAQGISEESVVVSSVSSGNAW